MPWRSEVVAAGEYELVQARVAAAIHNNHGAPPGDVTCFMCRRDATRVLEELHELGFTLARVVPVRLPAAEAAIAP